MSNPVIKSVRKLYLLLVKNKYVRITDFEAQAASDLIKSKIESGQPLMVARFGAVELSAMVANSNSKIGVRKYWKYIKGEIDSYSINDQIINACYINAGIFPPQKQTVQKFSELMLKDLKELDILGAWRKSESSFVNQLPNLIRIRQKDIEPYLSEFPWTKALENKTVLVIHPFIETIKKQYQKRNLLFENKDVLPKFKLKTIKAVQSIAGQENLQYKDWFQALESMKKKIDQIEFDVAIIGCGAYGFPLAAHVKRKGKQAIHLGGATQILFGIKGKRWENIDFVSKLFNEHWARPSEEETPKNNDRVEEGCYW